MTSIAVFPAAAMEKFSLVSPEGCARPLRPGSVTIALHCNDCFQKIKGRIFLTRFQNYVVRAYKKSTFEIGKEIRIIHM